LLVRAKKQAEPTFIFVNNRLEGFAPGTIAAIVDGIDIDGWIDVVMQAFSG